MTKNEDLKACPLCEGKCDTTYTPNCVDGAPTVFCKKCGLTLSMLTATHEPVIEKWNTRPTVTPTDGDAERALAAVNGTWRQYNAFFGSAEGRKYLRAALQSRTPPAQGTITVDISGIDNCMKMDAVTSIKILRELQGKIYHSNEIGWVIYEAINNAVEALKSNTPPVPVDTISIKREVLQGVREALEHYKKYATIKIHGYMEDDSEQATEAIASLDAVLSEGE